MQEESRSLAIDARSWGGYEMDQISGQRGEQIWRTGHTGVPEQGAAAGGRRSRIGRVVLRPRRATGFPRGFGGPARDTGHQETENSDSSVEKINVSPEAKIGKQEEALESWRRKEELEKRRVELEKREREELEKQKRELEKREKEELENREKEELEKREREELEKREREELEKQKIELEKWRREEELEKQRKEEEADNNLLEQEIREWERQTQEREAKLESKKREEQLEIQRREAEVKKQKQEEEQKRLTIEKKKIMCKKEEDHEQELLRQSKEQELQRQEREKILEVEGREWELERQRKEAEKLERKQMEEENLERQRRQEEEKQKKLRREEELKRKRREWELKKRTCEENLERERQAWAQEKKKKEEELKKQEWEEALKSQEAEKELRKQKRILDQLRMEREKELQRQKQDERDLRDIESINDKVKTFKGDFIGKTQTLSDHVKALYDVADAIDQDHKAAILAGCAGAGLSVAGGVVALSGAALAPFTGGASLVATVGVGGSFLGSFTRIVGGVKQNLDNTRKEKTVDEILRSCVQLLQSLEDNYRKLEKKIQALEKRELKESYRRAVERIKQSFFAFEPALMTEIFKGTLKSIIQLTGRLVSRMVVQKVSQKVSHAATTTAAQEVTKRMTQETTNYFSYEAIKQFLTFSSKEVSKKWYQDVARTSAVASGAAAAIFLPFDAKDFYKDAVHLNKGAKSEIAEEIRNAAWQLKKLIDHLNERLWNTCRTPENNLRANKDEVISPGDFHFSGTQLGDPCPSLPYYANHF